MREVLSSSFHKTDQMNDFCYRKHVCGLISNSILYSHKTPDNVEREEEDRAERESQQTLTKSNSPGTPSSNTSDHNCNESATIKLGVFSLNDNNKKG